ncbi:MAG: right-handed parallel beta-helix repeat-containing protein [Bacteroidales bacterium]|nr:right-handed parallel beta-helix repeat-containing protein [Bacteroidales bacterium]
MRKRYLHIAFTMLLSLIMQAAHAQLVRYVTTTGTYAGDGLSWATAKNNLQDAINDLHNHMVQAGITEGGCIYVAQGTYKPTESTEQMGGGVLFTAFKLYGGISVYGGYAGTETGDDLLPENREMKSATAKPWELKYETILSGNHSSSTPTTFTWNAKKETYDTSFPGNSYHVVWFATNGFDENGRAKPLNGTALMDGFTIEGGCAGNRTVENDREHNAFGGGVYMVEGAQLKHCIVQKNESTRRGGGLYLDGGGEVDYCYLHTNQCLGLGIVAGYGGGVCVEGNGKVLHSLIHNNTARIGGGAALSAEGVAGMECFNPAMAGCVVSNNTTTTEGGGVFLYQGGQMNHCSVVRNKCTGPNIIIQGRRYGRSAGVYVDNAAMIVNSVLWGGQVDANDNVQYAAYTPNSTDVLKPYMNYTAVSNHDLADWTSTSKLEVMAVGAVNSGTGGRFPDFLPGTDGKAVDDIPCGVETDAAATPESRWKPAGFSPLRERGVQVVDFAINERALRSHITTDIDGKSFAPRTSLGAYVSERTKYAPVLLPSIEDNAQKAYTLFVDPDREIMDLSTATHVGHSWAAPLGNINDALLWFSSYKGQEIEYYDGAAASSTTTGTMPTTATLQIVVKAGTCTTAGTYYSTRMRTSYLQMQDNVHLFGGYPDAATDRDLSGRDPLKNLTTISANIIDNGYQFNTCHVIGFGGANHAIVDGFRLAYAYSLPNKDLNNTVGTGSELYFNPILRDGGAVLLQDKIGGYGSMIGNKVRNCIVANCTSERGAAVFVQSSRSDVEIEVEFENCIIHNNTSTFETAGATPSAIYIESEAGGSVQVKFNHCNILKNVGYGLHLKGTGATVQLDNSMVWANATQAFARSEELADNANTAFISPILLEETGATLSGTNNLLDASATVPAGLTNTENKLTYLRSETTAEGITKEIYTYPVFVNPTKNIGATEEGDLTNYGGTVNFMPRNMNPMVNAATDASMSGTDISTNITRTYGGAADVGAVENTFLPENGKVYYVRTTGSDSNNGLSWGTAFATVQHALSVANTAAQSLGSSDPNIEIWVAAGTYASSKVNSSDESVYIIRDRINVYGAFPTKGTPGMTERQPLVSTKVKVTTGKNPADYETILTRENATTTNTIERILGQPYANNPYNSACVDYKSALWDGFTLQGGAINSYSLTQNGRNGGAGAAIYKNVILRNCVVTDNVLYNSAYDTSGSGGYGRAGGVYLDGGSIINCYVINNSNTGGTPSGDTSCDVCYGGGVYMYSGTMYNSVIAKNKVKAQWAEGAGVFMEEGFFFNNTIIGNEAECNPWARGSGGISIWCNASGGKNLFVFNSISLDNVGNYNQALGDHNISVTTNGVINCYNCISTLDPTKSYVRGYNKITFSNCQLFDEKNRDQLFTVASGSTFADYDLRPIGSSLAINAGINQPMMNGVVIADLFDYTDMDYKDRIQDCTVDIGAYEFNGAYSISPTTGTADDGVTPTASFFVTGPGHGTASAANAANAACMQKLQKVLDAAGRYKFDHPNTQVIVKLARVAGGGYAPSRSSITDLHDLELENPRTYTLMVPRGVEVWGGYTEDFTTRDVIANPTKLTGAYTADGQNVNCYHVVTFTNDLFDENGEKIGTGHTTTSWNGVTDPTLDPASSTASKKLNVQARAILDGLFIEDGDASGEIVVTGEKYREQNTHRYGGAAIVTNFAHVRNCILKNNQAAYGGGALFLEEGALVSGCVMEDNTAEWGGAVYVKQNSDAGFKPTEWENIVRFAHLYSCTIVKNQAHDAGGGLWFNNNLRVNSSVVWQNTGNNSANVCGQTDPYSTSAETKTSIYYPFTYSAIENLRAPGMNNISVHTEDSKGVRFDLTQADPYYYLHRHSVLARAGMDAKTYNELRTVDKTVAAEKYFYYPTLETHDLAGNPRTTYNLDGEGNDITATDKDFIEIGARAFNGPLMVMPDKTKLITRLFVVKPENVDEDIYNIMAEQDYVEGSSFAFPLQKLDDALLYIQNARKLYGEETVTVDDPGAIGKKESDGTCKVKNLKFEVFVSQGTYYPYRTVSGQYDYSRGNTFLVPEGVSIYGGVSHKKAEGEDGAFYTQHSYQADGVTDADDVTITSSGKTIKLKATNTRKILDGRELEDLNHNSIREPWEMKNQTILSGKSVNSESADNVYHVITCIADEDYVGTLPEGTSETSSLIIADTEREYTGVPIVLDGLQIMDGKAMGYDKSSVTNAYTYYRGGGVLVDGNWFKATRTDEGELPESDENYTRAADPRSVGRRSIPLTVRNCEFTNNRAGAGGAIFSNGVVELYSCNFAQNAAKRRAETDAPAAAQRSNGNGGAVFSSYVLSAVNTIFANNEAGVAEETGDLSLLDEVGSRGGAVFHAANGQYGSMQLMNCNFVRNQALSYPALYVLYPNRGGLLRKENPHKVINSIFWQNVVRTGDDITVNGEQKQMSLACNYWNRINQAFVADPLEFTDSRTDDDGNPQIGEMLWFCAYEDGLGCVPHFDDRNVIDYRTAEYTDVDAADPTLDKYIPVDVFTNVTYYERDEDGNIVQKTATNNGENAKYKWVTNNIYLAADNNALDGPNFVNPSLGAGVNNYLPSADWMVSRQNNLTDNGWTRIRQSVTADEDGTAYSCEFVDSDPSDNFPADAHGIYADTRKVRTKQGGSGLYIKMPIGDERYMQSASTDAILYRISKDPNPSQHQTFIDLGVYEYQHMPLIPSTAEEVDILWVSTQEKPENGEANGSSWLQPTSDLQRAIETLLASRNNHHKQINIIEGNYSPIYTIDSYMSFTINTGSLNTAATLPEHRGTTANGDFGVHSLTFQGGWSKDVKDVRDVEAYPTVWEMAGRSGVASEKMSTLLRISDAHNWYNTGSAATTVPATGEQEQRVIPIEIDGVTFQNTYGNQPESGSDMGEGAAIHYAPQYQYKLDSSGKPVGTEGNYTIDTETGGEKKLALALEDKPKLTIGRSVCRLNGTGSTVPAVTIGEGGGYSIIYNTLFHSNAGRSLTANNTRVVNCTFALNGDKLKLLDDRSATTSTHSLLMNSLLWRNGAANQDDDPTDAYEYELPSVTADYLAHNAIYGSVYTGDDTVNPDDGVISIKVGEGSYNKTNHSLTGTNSDVLGGPNFMNPLPQAVSEDDKLLRDFHLRPSARTINQGDDLTYAKQALDKAAALTDAEKSAETDLAYMPRFKSAGIDRGAYEFQGELQRVIYTDPNKMTTGTGETWGSPYGYGDLQSAIDLAAVFYTINRQRAYVFCKGGQKTGETLTPRAGVNVYAGIASNYTREATKEKTDDGDDTDGGFAEEDLHDYITYVLGDRTGIVTPNASRTGISGIHTTGAYPVYALMDGFDVTPAANVTRPVIDLGDADKALPVAVRNSVVHDTYNINMVSENGAAAAVRLRGGLLYNVLVRDCPASQPGVAATWLGTKARAVNCTFLGKGENGYAIETKASVPQVFHSITWNPDHTGSEPVTRLGTTASAYQNCNTNEEGYPFARYLQPVADNHPARPAAYTGNQDLWYQLEEMSKQMDCTATGITHEALYSNLQSALGLTETERQALIDYNSDRDLLGNPRLPQYNALIDRGCYETWNVPEGTAAQATYHYDGTGTAGSLSGGRRHPQEGSVVYLHAGASLVMSRDDFNPESAGAAGRNEVLRPGYLLLREGASLYSEGTAVSLPHVGVERTISNADAGALVALPYAFDYSQARLVSYHEAGGQLQQAVPGAGTEVCYYDGAQRAEGGYEAQTQDSPCWKPWTAGEREACMGVWYKPATAGTYRFTAADVTALGTAPIYREGYYGDTSEKQKTVSLTQADNRNTNGSKPDYTTPENMGWNLVGCPYLVSDYVSWANGKATDVDPEAYPMSLPRFVYTTDADGQFTSWPSWKAPTEGSFSPAHAFFTQTATLQATEPLTFTLPHYTGTPVAAVPRPCLSFTDGSGQSDVVTLQPCAEATEDMGFHLGSDGLHWAPLNPELPQLYAASTGTAHLDWMGAAPVGTEIPLGLYSGMGGFCTFSLPSPDTYATFTHVWLTDRLTGRVTDLKQNTYTVPLEADETTDIRFTLKFGGIAPNPGNSGEQALYQITARQGYIRIEGLTGGENIAVYDASGRLLLSDQARTNHYAAPFLPGNYVVKVEGYCRKVQVAP